MEGKKTISISGSSSFSGGTYDAIQISGSGKCAEPFTANSVRVSGSSSLATVEAGEMRISGSAKFSGRVSAEKMSVSGVCKIEEDCEAANLQLSGSMYARKGLRGTNGSVSGSIHVDGDMEFEQLTISGAAEVSGLMNAESLTIHLGGSCEIGEIGGSEIFVDVPPRHAGFLAKLLGGFAVPTLKCWTIEGERIRLENTTCDTVRGKNVVIGPGCEIGLVEYSDELTVDPDSRVQRKEKMNGQGE